jgi:hypothetical protein
MTQETYEVFRFNRKTNENDQSPVLSTLNPAEAKRRIAELNDNLNSEQKEEFGYRCRTEQAHRILTGR